MPASQPPRRIIGALAKPVAGVLLVGVLTTLAVVTDGYDAQDVPRLETSVWVTRDDGQYARVNTELGEFDTVRSVADLAGIVQLGAQATVFTQGYAQSWPVDPARPVDLGAKGTEGTSGARAINTPAGTSSVVAAGTSMVYLTNAGQVFLGSVPQPGNANTSPWQANPFAGAEVKEGEDPPRYVADATAIDASGRLVMYSSEEQGIRSYEVASGRFDGHVTKVPQAPKPGTDLELALVGGRWVLSSATDGLVWIEGLDKPVETGLSGSAVLQAGSADGDRVLLADAAGLVAIQAGKGQVTRLADGQGTPAAPIVVDGVAYAAWISPSGALLWSSEEDAVRALAIDATRLDEVEVISPVFRSNGDRAVLTETATGMVWTLPAGVLIPIDSWDPTDDRGQLQGTVVVHDVVEQQSPVAVNDAFGVRRGALVMLPVLLNDHDPNEKDILTVDPGSVSGLSDPSFGQVGLVSDDQQAVVRVSAAFGSATFTYAATDGMDNSAPATVTLTVVDEAQNTAPVWCGVPECAQEWPSPQVMPGGYVSVPVMDGWVDPEGDAIAISDVYPEDPNAPVTVVATADGMVVARHSDPNAGDGIIPLTVTVTDSLGATAQRTLELRISSAPAFVVEPMAISASAGERRLVSIDPYVSGGSGSYRLLDAVPSQGSTQSLSVAPGPSNGVIELSAAVPGRDFALYTVEDTKTLAQQTATIRYTVADGARPLTAPPLVTFVRPGEDATVDVLSSVQNTTGRVLMVAEASTADPGLSVSVVGQAYVRVSGSTVSGEPGKVGTARIVIADGTGGTTSTQLTVFLLSPSRGVGPIAAPDNVSVRAGAQVDIPVLANDVSPLGERLLLRPEVEGSGAGGELAFVSGDVVRYLAPTVPGVYSLRYWAYLQNDPGRLDSATLTVTVLPAGSNRAPQAPTISARVLAGQSVTIPVLESVTDPDGDAVVPTDVGQPAPGDGVATISGQGDAIIYRAPADGVTGGQVSFPYTVADAFGAEATGVVRVGVLAQDVDVAPITYGDYIGVELGSGFPVTISPLLNDRDPLGGRLELLNVVPNAPAGTTEYDRLAALIDDSTSLEDGSVVLLPGDVAGTHSYIYTVQSDSSFSTAEGLIVLGVSDSPGPDSLQVSDTTLTLGNRDELATGIDVVSGKVQWRTGDASQLTLSLWGNSAAAFSSSGWKISGELSQELTVVPFALTGTDSAGQVVTSYGFLRIPSIDDMRVQLRGNATPVEVNEEKSVEIAIRDFLDVGPSDVIELRQDESFAVQRDQALCTPTGALSVTYSAGREAPWTDSCSIAVRLEGQSVWSIVAIPVALVPRDPQAILSPISRTVNPGDTESIDLLADMISWEGGREGDEAALNLSVDHNGVAFIITRQGNVISAQAMADARPGTRETIRVTSSAYGGLTSAITLVVGTAPPDAPKGASFTHQCDVSRGASCAISVVGVAGEYDPFAGRPGSGLSLVSVGTTGTVTCPVATVTKASGSQVVATWPAGPRPVGGECVLDYTLSDAQGRTGQGTLTIDVLGYPQTPASVTTYDFSPTSVTLLVNLGPASQAHPAVSGVSIWENGSPVSAACAPAGPGTYRCLVGDLVNGERHTYTARAINSIGESLDTTGHTTWAYRSPEILSVTASPVYRAGQTSTTKGVVAVAIESSDDTKSFLVENTEKTILRTGTVTNAEVTLGVGPQELRLIPISKYKPPTRDDNSGIRKTASVTVAGSPFYDSAVTATPDGTQVTVTAGPLNPNYGPAVISEKWVAWTGSQPTCGMDASGGARVSGVSFQTSPSSVISGLAANTVYSLGVCGANGYGGAWSAVGEAFTWVPPGGPTGRLTYRIDTRWSQHGSRYTYDLTETPAVTPLAPEFVGVYFRYAGGGQTEGFEPGESVDPSPITVAYCLRANPTSCGAWATVTPDSVPTIVSVTFPDASRCVDKASLDDVTVSQAARGAAVVTFPKDDYVVTWAAGAFSNLQKITHPIPFCDTSSDPAPPPSP